MTRLVRSHQPAHAVTDDEEVRRERGLKLDRPLLARADDVGHGEHVGDADDADNS